MKRHDLEMLVFALRDTNDRLADALQAIIHRMEQPQERAGSDAGAWAVEVDGRIAFAASNKDAADSEASVYGTGPAVCVIPLYTRPQPASDAAKEEEIVAIASEALRRNQK